jgi:hypothetical protein
MTSKSLSSLLLGVALLGAGSLSLAAGGAKAATVCSFQTCAPGSTATVGDKTLTTISGPTLGDGDIELTNPTITPMVHAVDIDFQPELASITPGLLKYKLSIDPLNNHVYHKAVLRWLDGTNAPTSSVTKNIYSDSAFTTLLGSTSTNGGTIALPGIKDIWVEDLYTSGGALDFIRNDFIQVPGPLPLLGAGTAFGFSRRLRRRAKARVSLG